MRELVLDHDTFAVSARQAYERGRVGLGLRRAALLAPFAAMAFLQCARPVPVAIATVVLVTVVGVAAWRGQDVGRGATVGLAAGLGPFLLPLLSTATGVLCSTTVCAILPTACAVGGFVGGVVLGTRRGPRQSAARFWGAALAVTLAAGAVGCASQGMLGLLAMIAGVAAGGVPVALLRAARR